MTAPLGTHPQRRDDRTAGASLAAPHALSVADALAAAESGRNGLSVAEAEARLARFGENRLPVRKPPGLPAIFVRQFLSPIIYVLLVASGVSLALGEWSDAGFIFAVLLVNALIGTAQEYGAERSAAALRRLVVTMVKTVREGEEFEIRSEQLALGDVIILDAGSRVPADVRLFSEAGLELDESLVTGESLPVPKQAELVLPAEASLADRANMAFAGTMVARGQGLGVVTATGARTEIGLIALTMAAAPLGRPPLLVRIDRFTRVIAGAVAVLVLLLTAASLARGTPLSEVFHIAVAVAVSAIPEGLPVAMTVALAVASARMARRNVIVRRLIAVEALGSCTFVASDKTGTLTMNELTAQRLLIPGQPPWEVTGSGATPEGEVLLPPEVERGEAWGALGRLAEGAALCNAGFLGHRDGAWVHHGDAVDVSLLAFAHKVGVTRPAALADRPEVAVLPFESERQYAATLHDEDGGPVAFVKGAPERILAMCDSMSTLRGDAALDRGAVEAQVHELAASGFKVLAVASARLAGVTPEAFAPARLSGLTLLGLVGMIDPLRPEAQSAVAACQRAGLRVGMITGDHPLTALAIARDLGLASDLDEVVSGPELRAAAEQGTAEVDRIVVAARVFARVEPDQKYELVRSLTRLGHFVAVTGDGVNDAPALRAAHVGVAMGRAGTDVAREAAELIITDDNFASVVAGVEEGRVAYSNVRKVIYLLIATGAAELLLVFLTLVTGDPLPLLPAQLLWLNLVTNGIQDVALAFEPAEGDELAQPPRSPRERIFNRLMIERCLLSAAVIGTVSFVLFRWLLANGFEVEAARNLVLLQLVLFENILVGNSRSELRSILELSPLRNPLLLIGTAAAQLVHLAALYTPGLSNVLEVEPVSLQQWLVLLLLALTVFVAVELHKLARRRLRGRAWRLPTAGAG
jgi:magnesium-transporting ATPase (P-type)